MLYIFQREYAAAIRNMKATMNIGAKVTRISFVRAENSKLHSGRNESKLNVKVFMVSKAESITDGQFTPLSKPSLSIDKLVIKRMHENDCKPDRISFIPFATATNGGNERYDDKIANVISSTMPRAKTSISLDSGHFLQT
jgi:hypothetical protein